MDIGCSGTNNKGKRPSEKLIKLGIRSQDGDEVFYGCSYDKKIQYLFMNYCMEKNSDYDTFAFMYDEERVDPTKTPAELNLKDADMIDAMVHQVGGGF